MNDYKTPQETLLDRILIASLFIIFVLTMAFAPNVFKNHGEVIYDCRVASYPTAIDIPLSVIKACRTQQLKDHHGN